MVDKESYRSLDYCLALINERTKRNEPIEQDLQDTYNYWLKDSKPVEQKSETFIFDTLIHESKFGVSDEKKQTIIRTVDKLLEDDENANEPGLLLGMIQCGKTDTFEGVIGLAFDRGIDVVVVLTKGTTLLAGQTLKRLENDFSPFKKSDEIGRKTVYIDDIKTVWRKMSQSRVNSGKTIIVCMKQAKNMEHLIDMFKLYCPFMKEKKVLIVDDEADFASRNWRKIHGNEEDPGLDFSLAKISQQIDDFREIPKYCRYLQVTATPYSLFLQPRGYVNLVGEMAKPFRPRFTSLVPVHERYVGGQQYFVESKDEKSMYSHLFQSVSDKCMSIMGKIDKRYLNRGILNGDLLDLTKALIAYFVATSIRCIQARKENKYYSSSALVHVEISKRNHEQQWNLIHRHINDIKKAILEDDRENQIVFDAIDEYINDFKESSDKARKNGQITVEFPAKKEIIDQLKVIFDENNRNYNVQVVNSDEQINEILNRDTGELELTDMANVFIGGSILDRGITVKNMLLFFYGRNPKTFQQDTVLQHARMYGARSKEDMAVTRFFTTRHIYDKLENMNKTDEMLRKQLEQEKDGVIFITYTKGIIPTSPQKISVSDVKTIKKSSRLLPKGFWTKSKREMKKTIEEIDNLIVNSPNYKKKDDHGFFEIDKGRTIEILKKIESTYVYDKKYENEYLKNDIKEMLCAIERCANKGKLFALHRTNRSLKRIRANGGWIDSPDDGRTDYEPSREKAGEIPVIMFLRQNGESEKDYKGRNVGWNDAPFYWPVLVTQDKIEPAMFVLEQKTKTESEPIGGLDILEGIDPTEVLKLTYSGNLENHFGKEGTEYDNVDRNSRPVESRGLKEKTALKYILRGEDRPYKLNPNVPFDTEHDHGLYSYDNGKFPFVFRPYKYMLLTRGRNRYADQMLLELAPMDQWYATPVVTPDAHGDIRDYSTGKVLAHAEMRIITKSMKEYRELDPTLTQWVIYYPIRKVLKYVENVKTENTEDDE